LFGGHDLRTAKGSVDSGPMRPISVEDLERGLRNEPRSNIWILFFFIIEIKIKKIFSNSLF